MKTNVTKDLKVILENNPTVSKIEECLVKHIKNQKDFTVYGLSKNNLNTLSKCVDNHFEDKNVQLVKGNCEVKGVLDLDYEYLQYDFSDNKRITFTIKTN